MTNFCNVHVDTETKLFPFLTRSSLGAKVSRSEKALEKDGSFLKISSHFQFLLLCHPGSEWSIRVNGMLFFIPHKVNFSAVK
jgi:hypothetical protein